MHGDFSRDSFRKRRHFSRVLMQQGRVLLDADWNEQTAILLHHLRTLAADLIGPHGGPRDGFRISGDDEFPYDFAIARGHYYVDGILCENDVSDRPLRYTEQPDYPLRTNDRAELRSDTAYLVYLDVWERHLNHLQARDVREVALGGPDSATRARTVYQVKVVEEPRNEGHRSCGELLDALVAQRKRFLRARAWVRTPSEDPCVTPPQARYRGPENQLYRVEIHRGGRDATFTWSRDNGSVVFGIRSLHGDTVSLDGLGFDVHTGLKEGDWVEIVDDRSALRLRPRQLLAVESVDRVDFTVRLTVPDDVDLPTFDEDSTTHPLLRRWDHAAVPVAEGKWLDLEDGVQVYFEPGGHYRAGDHWLVPARTATGDVLWPRTSDGPRALPPDGIEHHYAPLARISLDSKGVVTVQSDCRCSFDPTETPVNQVVFEANTADLTETATTRLTEDAHRLRERLAADPDLWAEVRGFASPDETDIDQLALTRADRVRDFYVTQEVPSVSSVGRGAVDPADVAVEQQRRAETVLVSGCATRPAVRHPVRTIDGVGEKFAQRLEHAGVTDAAEVAALSPEQLTRLLSAPEGRAISRTTAESIIDNARGLTS